MKLYCKGEYHNSPANLHFAGPGVVEIDDAKAEFLLRDAPENFARYQPSDYAADEPFEAKALDEPPADKMVRRSARKK